jgi:hypothetical protein
MNKKLKGILIPLATLASTAALAGAAYHRLYRHGQQVYRNTGSYDFAVPGKEPIGDGWVLFK